MGFDENLRYLPFSIKTYIGAPDCNSFTNAELHIRGGIEDNLKIFFISQRNVCLEETVLMMGHNIRFKGVIWKIIPKLSLLLFLICGWSGGATVLGKLPVLGRPTNFDYSRARAYCACSWCGCGLFEHFFSRLSFLSYFFLPLFRRRPDID